MFRHSWGGAEPRIHADFDKAHEEDDDDPSTSTSYTLVEDYNVSTSLALQRADSIIPIMESKSFRNIPLMQESNRVVPLMDELSPANEGRYRRHSEFTMRHSEPGLSQPIAATPVPTIDSSFVFPKVKTSRREHQQLSRPPAQSQTTESGASATSRSTPSSPSLLATPTSSLVIAYQPLNRST